MPVINTGDKAGIARKAAIAMDCYSQPVEPAQHEQVVPCIPALGKRREGIMY
jgi:hypothetical protein